jgi:hypothetical protein
MIRLRNALPLAVVVLVAATILGVPSSARAAFKLSLQEDGGAITQVDSEADFTTVTYNATFGDFKVTLYGGSSDNGITISDLGAGVTSIQNSGLGAHTLTIYLTQTNYTLPPGNPLNVESGLGGSVTTGTVGLTGIFQAYADKNNNEFGMADYTNGPQTATQTGSTFDTGSASGEFSRAGDYSLTSVATLNISAGGKINVTYHEDVTPTPAPAGILLVLSALPILGIGTWLRGRKAKGQTI